MAWLDDRVWCHPKLTDLTDRQFRVWVHGNAYSAGFGTRGILTVGQQKTIGCDTRTRNALIEAGVWDDIDGRSARIHDWDEHNSKRDDRRAKDRDRKREARRKSAGTSAGQSNGTSPGASAGPAHVEGSEGSDGSEEVQELNPKAVALPHERPGNHTHIKNLIDQSLREAAA